MMFRDKLRCLRGRRKDRPHHQDHENGSKKLGFHDIPRSYSKADILLYGNPDLNEVNKKSVEAAAKNVYLVMLALRNPSSS
jgi:hypothetical protein